MDKNVNYLLEKIFDEFVEVKNVKVKDNKISFLTYDPVFSPTVLMKTLNVAGIKIKNMTVNSGSNWSKFEIEIEM